MRKGATAGRAISAEPAVTKLNPGASRGSGRLAPAPETISPKRFRSKLMAWYSGHARELPWRGIQNPYATWLSEIMLQQTRVATVIDRYGEFLQAFPTIDALAAADENAVLALWSGLGYYRRARMLHRGAQFVARELGGQLPDSSAELRTLPGIGEYTAAAIASIAFGESIAVVDGNVERVLLRVLGLPEDKSSQRRAHINATAQSLVPPPAKPSRGGAQSSSPANPPGDHNQAMMELGATVCLPREPLCLQCPVVALCRTRGEHPTPPRGQPLSRQAAYLLSLRKRGLTTEVLLERRAAEASLMPGMLELPPLPLDAVAGREPVLRLRHGITNTNYQVQVYAEGTNVRAHAAEPNAFGSTASQASLLDAGLPVGNEDEDVFEAGKQEHGDAAMPRGALLAQVPARASDLEWVSSRRLRELPLTGLARKCLQRLRVMPADVRTNR